MANFTPAYAKTVGHEGGYSNHSADLGKETYRGVSRRFFPQWAGWPIVDQIKQSNQRGNWDRALSENGQLQGLVFDFYKAEFWDKMSGDNIRNQRIAEELFDTAVNMGARRAVRFLQKALNALNRNQRSWQNIRIDGDLGPTTLKMLDIIEPTVYDRGSELSLDAETLLKMLNVQQGMHYMNLMDKNESQEEFARGWFKRVEL